jgi:uncharacterized membrane protein
MFEIPDPIHPAIAHIPIVLVFLGTLISILTIFTRRGALPLFAAFILILAAGAAQLAVITGGDQVDDVVQRMPESRPLLLRHAESGELTRTGAAVAACSAVVALAFYKARTFRRVMAFVTTIIAAGACYFALKAAENGVEMVYHHGIGIELRPVKSSANPSSTPKTPNAPVSPPGGSASGTSPD